jgi:hypothetical protein
MANDPQYGDKASKILEKIEKGEEAVISTIVIIQVCSHLKWKGKGFELSMDLYRIHT